MGIGSSHLGLNFENEPRERAAVEEARKRWEKEKEEAEKKKKEGIPIEYLGPFDERVVSLAEKYKKLLEMDGFTPDSPMIKEFVKLSERSLSSYPEAIDQLRKEIKLFNETKFGSKDNGNDYENDESLRLAA